MSELEISDILMEVHVGWFFSVPRVKFLVKLQTNDPPDKASSSAPESH